MKCSSCQSELQSGFKFCPYCGQEANKISSCYSCNNQVKPEWVSCPFCGSSLKGQAKPQDFLREVFNPKPHHPKHGKGHSPYYEHGHHYGSSGSSRRRHKKGFLGRIFS